MTKYLIYGIVAILLLILTIVMHLIVLKREKEEKEYLDLKFQKEKVTSYNIVRDILLNILMFLLVMSARIYLGNYTALVILPSFLIFCYYNKRRCDTRFSIYLFLLFGVLGVITGSITNLSFQVMDMLTLGMILMLCVLYSRMKLIGIFGIAIIAAITGTDDIHKFVLFVMFLILAYVYEHLRKISYIAIYLLCYCLLNLHNFTYLTGLAVFGVLLVFIYFKSTHKVVKKDKKNDIDLNIIEEENLVISNEPHVHFTEKKDFVNFDINEIEDKKQDNEFVNFDIDEE